MSHATPSHLLTAISAPLAAWAHPEQHTAQGELLANAPQLPSRAERRRAQQGATPASLDVIRITGELVADAVVRYQAGTSDTTAGRRAWLQVRLMLPGALFVMAAEELGADPVAHHTAHQRTHHLRRGVPCTIYGKGAIVVTQHGEQVLQVLLPKVFINTTPSLNTAAAGG
jgi:hypothetical protein